MLKPLDTITARVRREVEHKGVSRDAREDSQSGNIVLYGMYDGSLLIDVILQKLPKGCDLYGKIVRLKHVHLT